MSKATQTYFPGDLVRIVRKVEFPEDTLFRWDDAMDALVGDGKVYVVQSSAYFREIDAVELGKALNDGSLEGVQGYIWPAAALELVAKADYKVDLEEHFPPLDLKEVAYLAETYGTGEDTKGLLGKVVLVTEEETPYFEVGDLGLVVHIDEDGDAWAHLPDRKLYGNTLWCLRRGGFEVIPQ